MTGGLTGLISSVLKWYLVLCERSERETERERGRERETEREREREERERERKREKERETFSHTRKHVDRCRLPLRPEYTIVHCVD